MKPTHTTFSQGFTLIEVLVAILILGLVIGSMIFANSFLLGRKSNNNTYAYNAARQGLDIYRSAWSSSDSFAAGLKPANIPLTLKSGCVMETPVVKSYSITLSGGAFTMTETASTPDMRSVEITVKCPDMKEIFLKTEIADPTVKVQ